MTADNSYIKVWSPPQIFNSKNNYQNIKLFEINEITSDLLLIQKGIVKSSQPFNKTLKIINIIPLFSLFYDEEKLISNIDCKNSQNCLFLFRDYILANCNK